MAPSVNLEELPLTASDLNFLKAAVICFTQPPQASYYRLYFHPFGRPSANVTEIQLDKEKMAELLGIKDRSIDHRWWSIRKKLGQHLETITNAPADPQAGRKTNSVTPKKRGLAPDDDGKDDVEVVTPKRGKKAGATGSKRGTAKKEGNADKAKAKNDEA